MRWYKTSTVAAISLSLAGCDATPAGQSKPTRALAENASERTEASPGKARAQEALDFIVSRMRKLDLAPATMEGSMGVTWAPSKMSLASRGWKWSEEYSEFGASAVAVASSKTVEAYSVNPKELSYPVQVKSVPKGNSIAWAVNLECASSRCFHAVGRKEASSGLAGSDLVNTNDKIDEHRAENLWYLPDEATAKRVAKALEVVIAYEGGKQQAF
ncbi:MAG: hypothetical protein EON58_01925 [Alphaproteobacteria bacterium]|nr:MAG: hypothetical protein EON58_01925 [Alphaproteobacteria bacterium]